MSEVGLSSDEILNELYVRFINSSTNSYGGTYSHAPILCQDSRKHDSVCFGGWSRYTISTFRLVIIFNLSVVCLVLSIYDYLLLWNQEYTCIWKRRITLVTVLYIGIRYVAIVDMFVQVFGNPDSITVKPSYLSSGVLCLLLLQEARDRPFNSRSIYS